MGFFEELLDIESTTFSCSFDIFQMLYICSKSGTRTWLKFVDLTTQIFEVHIKTLWINIS